MFRGSVICIEIQQSCAIQTARSKGLSAIRTTHILSETRFIVVVPRLILRPLLSGPKNGLVSGTLLYVIESLPDGQYSLIKYAFVKVVSITLSFVYPLVHLSTFCIYYRRGDVLCAYHERVPETVLSTVMRNCAAVWKKSLVEFVSTESFYIDKSGK